MPDNPLKVEQNIFYGKNILNNEEFAKRGWKSFGTVRKERVKDYLIKSLDYVNKIIIGLYTIQKNASKSTRH